MFLSSSAADSIRSRVGSVVSAVKENGFFSSALEIIFSLAVSNAAIFVALFVRVVATEGANLSFSGFFEVVTDIVKSAEIIFYVLGFIAPTLWIMIVDWRARHHAGFFWILLLSQGAVVTLCAVCYGLSQLGMATNQSFVNQFAVVSLILALVTWYLTLAFHKNFLRRANQEVATYSGADDGAAERILNQLRENNG